MQKMDPKSTTKIETSSSQHFPYFVLPRSDTQQVPGSCSRIWTVLSMGDQFGTSLTDFRRTINGVRGYPAGKPAAT